MVDKWSVNGKVTRRPIYSPPDRLAPKLIFDNQSDEAHPLHLHRHTFELRRISGAPTSGIFKDVVVIQPMTQIEATFTANNHQTTLFHITSNAHGLRLFA